MASPGSLEDLLEEEEGDEGLLQMDGAQPVVAGRGLDAAPLWVCSCRHPCA